MADTDNTDDAPLLSLNKNELHEALSHGRYIEASELIKSTGEDYLMKCYENYHDYEPPSLKSCLHIIAGLRDEKRAVPLCQECLSQIKKPENRDRILNRTVVEEFGILRVRVAAIHIAAYRGNTRVVSLLCHDYEVDANSSSETLEEPTVNSITPLY